MGRFLRAILLVSSLTIAVNAQTPVISKGGVVNGASLAAGQAIAPGSLVYIFGSEFASGVKTASTVPLSTKLEGVTVTFNHHDAPLNEVEPGVINAQIPWEVLPGGGPGMVHVVVTRNGVPSMPLAVEIVPQAPGIFATEVREKGKNIFYALATNSSDKNSLPWPTGTAPKNKTPQRPAKIGDVLVIMATGLGEVNPPVADGHSASDHKMHVPLKEPEVLIGGIKATVLGSMLSPQVVGMFEVTAQIPEGAPKGNIVSIQLSAGSVTSPAARASIAIE
jgi:uncharacterized protein (TIGR03437 family)